VRVNVNSAVEVRRGRQTRVTDCQIKALSASSVEIQPEGSNGFVASGLQAASSKQDR
jgi:hypothetical protein